MYRRLASPLHAARASAGAAYCLVIVAAILATHNPIVLGALAVVIFGAVRGARVGREVARAAKLAVPLALAIALINPLIVREGLTVFAQLGEIPPFGQVDLTVEALAYGALDGVRVLLVVLTCALFSAAIDPDDLLRLLRRVSFRSALTAVLAVRLVPVLARDARRMEEARRCRPDAGGRGPAARLAVLRAVTVGALDRAGDVAATLEVRGYAAPRAAARPEHEPWSRHDRAFLAAAVALLALTVAAPLAGLAGLTAYPLLSFDAGPAEAVLGGLIVLVALLPFADRRGVER